MQVASRINECSGNVAVVVDAEQGRITSESVRSVKGMQHAAVRPKSMDLIVRVIPKANDCARGVYGGRSGRGCPGNIQKANACPLQLKGVRARGVYAKPDYLSGVVNCSGFGQKTTGAVDLRKGESCLPYGQ